MTMTPAPPGDIDGARALAVFGDSITTDHISPAGAIKPDSPAGRYLLENGVSRAEFNSYGARRGNHEVMMRGTFANIRIRNRMLDNVEGGFTRYAPTGETMPIYDAAMAYKHDGTPLVVLAGKEYGTGSSRDWAAKGTLLLGVRAVIAESFERIHRSNLVGMGVLPLQFRDGESAESLGLDRQRELHDPRRRRDRAAAGCRGAGDARGRHRRSRFTARCRIDTYNELEYFRSGGILQYVLRRLRSDRLIDGDGLRLARRSRRLGRRVADPWRLRACHRREAHRPVAALPVDEPGRRRRLHHQRLVAPRIAFDDAQRDLDADRGSGVVADMEEKRIVDLSHVIEEGMTTYKGLPGPHICDFWEREGTAANYDDGSTFQIGRIDMVANTGTYLDAPFHRYAEGADLAELPLPSLADLPGIVVRRPWENEHRHRRRRVRRPRRRAARRCWSTPAGTGIGAATLISASIRS